jgi:hypothetical protein
MTAIVVAAVILPFGMYSHYRIIFSESTNWLSEIFGYTKLFERSYRLTIKVLCRPELFYAFLARTKYKWQNSCKTMFEKMKY